MKDNYWRRPLWDSTCANAEMAPVTAMGQVIEAEATRAGADGTHKKKPMRRMKNRGGRERQSSSGECWVDGNGNIAGHVQLFYCCQPIGFV